MTLVLRPLAPHDVPAWIERSVAEYAADLVTMGATPAEAQRRARASIEDDVAEGSLPAGHVVFDLLDGAEASVGYLWVGPDTSDDPTAWWVWDVVVDTSGVRADSPALSAGDALELPAKSLMVLRDHEDDEPDLDHSVAASLAARTGVIDTIPASAPQAELPH